MKTQDVNFEDIIFENRNQEYGAYELRKNYPKRGTMALVISLSILILIVGVPLIASIIKQRNYNKYLEQTTTMEMENIKKINPDEIAPPPPPPPAPPVREIRFTAPKIVDELTEPDQELSSFEDLAENANKGDLDTNEVVIVPKDEEKGIDGKEEVFEPFAIQEKPLFPGGDAALIKFVGENTNYPMSAIENNIEGTVYVRFVVTKTGDVGQANVMRPVDPSLDEEALRVVKDLPKWTPGKNNGNPVSVWFIIPVKFKLQQK